MATGTITRIVNTHGSSWGLARHDREPRHVFFNAASLVEQADFASLSVGDAIEFDEELDRANGMRAINLRPIHSPRAEQPADGPAVGLGADL